MSNDFEDLKGKILAKITGGIGDVEMRFETSTGENFSLYHDQD